MLHRYREGRVKQESSPLKQVACEHISGFEKASANFQIDAALKEALLISQRCNMFVEMVRPWSLAKKQVDKLNVQALDSLFSGLSESLRIIAILISPVLPRAAHGIFDQLNWKMELSGKQERFSLADADRGRLPDGHVVGKPVPLFPRIER